MKIASMERIVSVQPHTNADALELVTVLGWQVVCKKGEFKPGDLVVYINIDSQLSPHQHFDFLANKNYRIRPIRLRGEISQGICFPLTILQDFMSTDLCEAEEGQDVSEIIGAKHWEKPIPVQLAGVAKGLFPSFLVRTDEDNLRNYPDALSEVSNQAVYYTLKMDGSSGTFFLKDGEFGVCSRGLQLKEDDQNVFWQMAHKYSIEDKLRKHGGNVCVQGEVYGPGIQKNPSGVKEVSLALFNLYDINAGQYASLNDLDEFCRKHDVPMVPVLEVSGKLTLLGLPSLEDLISHARGLKYENGKPAEGMVIRTVVPMASHVLKCRRWSGKILNELYDL
jgi:RNA ligase (TIGR02306 family)